MSERYSADEKRELAERLGEDDAPGCPRCGRTVERRAVPPRPEVAYVRDRIWVVCGGCGRSAVFDRRELERGGEE